MSTATTSASTGTSGMMAVPVVPAKRDYLDDVTRAKGLAIILVVVGHIVTGRPPLDNDWYRVLRGVIYDFHMPFFIYLSGYMLFYTRPDIGKGADEGRFLLRRAHRLLVPFLIFGAVIVIGKHFASRYVHVDNYSESFARDLVNLVWNTRHSAAQSVWYIFVLLEMTVAAVVLRKIVSSPIILFAIALPLSVLDWTPILYIDRFFLYLPFFYLGAAAALHRIRWVALLDRAFWIGLIAFPVAILLSRMIGVFHISLLACGLTSIFALHGFCRRASSSAFGVFAFFGTYSFVIYLLNTVGIGVAKAVLLKFMPWDGVNFLVFFAALLAGGLFGPVIAKMLVFRRIGYLDRMTS